MNDPQIDRVLNILADVQMQVHEIRGQLAGAVKELYTVEEVARITGRAEYTVRNWIKSGKIRAQRIAGTGPRGRLLVHRSELGKLVRLGNGKDIAGISVGAP